MSAAIRHIHDKPEIEELSIRFGPESRRYKYSGVPRLSTRVCAMPNSASATNAAWTMPPSSATAAGRPYAQHPDPLFRPYLNYTAAPSRGDKFDKLEFRGRRKSKEPRPNCMAVPCSKTSAAAWQGLRPPRRNQPVIYRDAGLTEMAEAWQHRSAADHVSIQGPKAAFVP